MPGMPPKPLDYRPLGFDKKCSVCSALFGLLNFICGPLPGREQRTDAKGSTVNIVKK